MAYFLGDVIITTIILLIGSLAAKKAKSDAMDANMLEAEKINNAIEVARGL